MICPHDVDNRVYIVKKNAIFDKLIHIYQDIIHAGKCHVK